MSHVNIIISHVDIIKFIYVSCQYAYVACWHKYVACEHAYALLILHVRGGSLPPFREQTNCKGLNI